MKTWQTRKSSQADLFFSFLGRVNMERKKVKINLKKPFIRVYSIGSLCIASDIGALFENH